MTPERWKLVNSIFREAETIDDAARRALLDERCDGDQALRAEVERLLAADAAGETDQLGDGQVETVVVDPFALPRPASLEIPGYDILREIHRGGQGVVYQAVQQSTKRKVAVKVLLDGHFASASAKRRFEREIELVASLKHANIVSVYESGTAADGRRFCVMDYVRGVPLTQYIADQSPDRRAALRLFADVCEAVGYAHRKGVIHRDLKPSNILVDAAGRPRVLDFGLAKQVGGPPGTVVTVSGTAMGTPAYMSPEQVRGNPDLIDIRTDIYSLGVMLYEIITGHLPYPEVRSDHALQRCILDEPPIRPRTRGTSVSFDLETIVMRCLEKRPAHRYQTVPLLKQDIDRFLEDVPILARPTGPLTRAFKYARRHRVGFSATIATLLLSIATAWFAYTRHVQHLRTQEETVAKLISQARAQRRDGSFAAARKLLTKALQISGNNSIDAHVALAWTIIREASKTKNPDLLQEALASAKQAVVLDPDNYDAVSVLCVAQRDARRFDDAIATCGKATEMGQGKAAFSACINLAHAYLGRAGSERDLKQARRFFALGTELAPTRAGLMGWYNLAVLERALGDRDDAEDALAKADDVRRRFPASYGDIHYGRICLLEALLLIQRGDTRSLSEATTKLMLADDAYQGTNARVKRLSATVSLRTHNWQDAMNEASAAMKMDDAEKLYCHLILAIAHANLGNIEQARSHLAAANVDWPDTDYLVRPDGTQYVWIDTREELESLRSTARQLLPE